MQDPTSAVAEMLSWWGLDPASAIVTTPRGESNRTYLVGSPEPSHVLRIHGDADIERVCFEHQLLNELAGADLPFATPVPIELLSGGTIAIANTSRGPRPAALFRWIPGEHPHDGDVLNVARAGEALAQLDAALARIAVTLPVPEFDGDLAKLNALADDLDSVGELDAPTREYIRRAARTGLALYPSLPRQLIHGDFAFGNVLLAGDRVVGMLDFEFAGRDARAMELASALTLVLDKENREALWRPFVRAYLSTLPLEHGERAAVPELLAVRNAVALLWWLGRERAGAPTTERIERHIERARVVDGWVAAHGSELEQALFE